MEQNHVIAIMFSTYPNVDHQVIIAKLTRQFEQQRRQDLQQVSRTLREFDWYTDSRFRRSEGVLQQLIPAVQDRTYK